MSKNLRRQLKHSYSVISKALYDNNQNPWIKDNFYVIDRHYRGLLKNKRVFSLGEFYDCVHIYCERCDYSAEPKALQNYLNSRNRHFEFWELVNIRAVIALNVINRLATVLEENNCHFLIPCCVKTLISLSDPAYDDLVSAVWYPEKLIGG